MKILLFWLLMPFSVLFSKNKTLPIKPECPENPILTGRKWEVQKLRFLQNNRTFYYNRDNDSESNFNFESDYIIFNCDGSGIYHQSDDQEYQLKWKITEDKKNAIEYTLFNFRNKKNLKVNWEDIEISNELLKYHEYYTSENDIPSLGYGVRISKDTFESVEL